VAAGGGAHDADLVWFQVPIGGMIADQPDGAGHIVEHRRMVVAVAAEAVLQHEARDAVGVEPNRVVPALMGRQTSVASPWADHHGRPRGLVRGGPERGEGGDVLDRIGPEGARGGAVPEGDGGGGESSGRRCEIGGGRARRGRVLSAGDAAGQRGDNQDRGGEVDFGHGRLRFRGERAHGYDHFGMSPF